MLEMILLVSTGLVLPPLVRLYLRYFSAQGMQHRGFEAWCEREPLVFAMLYPLETADAALPTVQAALDGAPAVTNFAGGFPWGHYRVTLRAERLNDQVLGVFVKSARRLRGHEKRPAFLAVVERVSASPVAPSEMWLHGEMYSDGVDERAPEITWRGGRHRERGMYFRRSDMLPHWLQQTFGGGPPRRDRGAEPQRVPGWGPSATAPG